MPAVALRVTVAGLGVGTLLLGVITLVAGSGPAGAVPQSQTFSFTGAPQSFVVPPNVCQLTVDAFGAQGGAQQSVTAADAKSSAAAQATPQPGLGGEVQATITVAPGETLSVFVGGEGGDGAASASATPGAASANATPGAGGFNGGAAGGSDTADAALDNVGTAVAVAGGGGGGASDVRQSSNALTDRLVVAGGGGGAGGGGATASASSDSTKNVGNVVPGGSGGAAHGGGGSNGTGTNPGGGGGGASNVGGSPGTGTGTPAQPGTLGTGGGGGSASANAKAGGPPQTAGVASTAGGGGGGGNFGGGGGGPGMATVSATGTTSGSGGVAATADTPSTSGSGGVAATADTPSASGSGGGGGGSPLGPPGATFTDNARSGNGQVTIAFDAVSGGCQVSPLTATRTASFTG